MQYLLISVEKEYRSRCSLDLGRWHINVEGKGIPFVGICTVYMYCIYMFQGPKKAHIFRGVRLTVARLLRNTIWRDHEEYHVSKPMSRSRTSFSYHVPVEAADSAQSFC